MSKAALFFSLLLCGSLFAAQPETYFEYAPEEIESLRSEESSFHFSEDALKKWDEFASQAFENEPASLKLFRICAYLYIAQEEAAKLSNYTKGKLAGSLDPVSYAVIALFLPDKKRPSDFKEDAFSNALASMIGKKVKERVEKEEARRFVFDVPENLRDDYYVGLTIAKWLPWYAIPATAYWPPPPPPISDKQFWDGQIKEIKRRKATLTEKEKEGIMLWAGKKDLEKSDWRMIANTYLFSQRIPLPKILRVRSVLAMSLYDAFIVSFQSKYAYLVLRPSMYDPTLETVIAVPNHPSYPSNHSVTSSAAATVLSYFFPSESKHWQRLEKEACDSRILAAIHYPIDDKEGRKAGKEVAEAVLAGIN